MADRDEDLPALLATDVPRHFPAVVVVYQQRLYAFALRLTGSPHDAEDIVQEAFLGAYVSLENYPPWRIQTLKLHPWLYRVTLNAFRHHTRGARLRVVPLDLSSADNPALQLANEETDRPEELFAEGERRQDLEALVARLPERYRVAVTCYYFEHLSYQEVADLLDQPVGTVKSTISRGTRLLRTMLAADATQQTPERRIPHGASG